MAVTLPNKTCDLIAWRVDWSTYVRYNEVMRSCINGSTIRNTTEYDTFSRVRDWKEGPWSCPCSQVGSGFTIERLRDFRT